MIIRLVRWYLRRFHDMQPVDSRTLASLVDTAEWAHTASLKESGRNPEATLRMLSESVGRLRFTPQYNYLILPGGPFDGVYPKA